MPTGLKRYQQNRDAHFVTFSCDQREPLLAQPGAYEVFEQVLERTRKRHRLLIYGYVLMPEHVHLLTAEPPKTLLETVIKVVKQETSKKLNAAGRKHFWLDRYHDFNVFSEEKFKQKLRYLHRNPVKRGMVSKPEEWRWSSFCHYQTGLPGTVEIESWWTEQARVRVRGLRPETILRPSDRLPVNP